MTPTPFSRINELFSEKTPSRLYHYTSASGFLGIISSKEVWATETPFLNDEMEIGHAKTCFSVVAFNLGNNNASSSLSENEKEFLDLLEWKCHHTKQGVFVSSFSENGDQLSQWRAYGGGQDGYSIGFPSDKLREAADTCGFQLARCIYDEAQQQQIALEVIQHLFAKYKNSDHSKESMESITEEVVDLITDYGALLKHPSFLEEQEWRIFTYQVMTGDSRINHRTLGARVIPYVAIPFGDLIKTDLQVFVGPSTSADANTHAAHGALQKYFGGGCSVGRSRAPYRSGR